VSARTIDRSSVDCLGRKIVNLVADVKNFFSQEEADEKNFKSGGSFSYAGIGASGNMDVSGKSLRKSMTDKGWKFEAKGKFRVPKSFEVFVVRDTALKTEGALSMVVLRTAQTFVRFKQLVSASNKYWPQTSADALVALEDARANLRLLTDKVTGIDQACAVLSTRLDNNLVRIGWRSTGIDGSTKTTPRDNFSPFEVEFSPDVPVEVIAVNGGMGLNRGQHSVSHLFAEFQHVRIEGTKVKGDYKWNLSDDDWNDGGGWINIVVLAKLKEK
jgi:hypothetical protein